MAERHSDLSPIHRLSVEFGSVLIPETPPPPVPAPPGAGPVGPHGPGSPFPPPQPAIMVTTLSMPVAVQSVYKSDHLVSLLNKFQNY
jgi:hypothetical protein